MKRGILFLIALMATSAGMASAQWPVVEESVDNLVIAGVENNGNYLAAVSFGEDCHGVRLLRVNQQAQVENLGEYILDIRQYPQEIASDEVGGVLFLTLQFEDPYTRSLHLIRYFNGSPIYDQLVITGMLPWQTYWGDNAYTLYVYQGVAYAHYGSHYRKYNVQSGQAIGGEIESYGGALAFEDDRRAEISRDTVVLRDVATGATIDSWGQPDLGIGSLVEGCFIKADTIYVIRRLDGLILVVRGLVGQQGYEVDTVCTDGHWLVRSCLHDGGILITYQKNDSLRSRLYQHDQPIGNEMYLGEVYGGWYSVLLPTSEARATLVWCRESHEHVQINDSTWVTFYHLARLMQIFEGGTPLLPEPLVLDSSTVAFHPPDQVFRLAASNGIGWLCWIDNSALNITPLDQINEVREPVFATFPHEFQFGPAYPNPFNPKTTISFELPSTQQVHLMVYDVVGRQVARLIDGRLEAGKHAITFDGASLASGSYFARLQTDRFNKTIKLVLLK